MQETMSDEMTQLRQPLCLFAQSHVVIKVVLNKEERVGQPWSHECLIGETIDLVFDVLVRTNLRNHFMVQPSSILNCNK